MTDRARGRKSRTVDSTHVGVQLREPFEHVQVSLFDGVEDLQHLRADQVDAVHGRAHEVLQLSGDHVLQRLLVDERALVGARRVEQYVADVLVGEVQQRVDAVQPVHVLVVDDARDLRAAHDRVLGHVLPVAGEHVAVRPAHVLEQPQHERHLLVGRLQRAQLAVQPRLRVVQLLAQRRERALDVRQQYVLQRVGQHLRGNRATVNGYGLQGATCRGDTSSCRVCCTPSRDQPPRPCQHINLFPRQISRKRVNKTHFSDRCTEN